MPRHKYMMIRNTSQGNNSLSSGSRSSTLPHTFTFASGNFHEDILEEEEEEKEKEEEEEEEEEDEKEKKKK